MYVAATIAKHWKLQAFLIGNYEFAELFLVFCEKSLILRTILLSTLFNLFLKVRFELINFFLELYIRFLIKLQLILSTIASPFWLSYFCIHFINDLLELFIFSLCLSRNSLDLITFFIKFCNLFLQFGLSLCESLNLMLFLCHNSIKFNTLLFHFHITFHLNLSLLFLNLQYLFIFILMTYLFDLKLLLICYYGYFPSYLLGILRYALLIFDFLLFGSLSDLIEW